VTYQWDRAGNRTQIADAGVWKTYTTNTINQYTAAEGSTVTNDPAEHQIIGYNGVTFTYYNDERLSSLFNGTTWTNFYYDALGRCVKRVRDNWDYRYIYYDGEREIFESGSGGGAIDRNVYGKGIDEILMRIDNTFGTFYYQQDHEGNVTHLTDGNGAIIEKYQYDAFGAPVIYNAGGTVISASAYGNPFLFTGRRFQSTFGIYEYRARAYHPRLGRFTSEDPKLFDAGDYNLFRYCHNDPVDLTDPMGLETDWGGAGPQNPDNHAAVATAADMREAGNAQWALAKWGDSSNNYQNTFAQFAAAQGLTMGQASSHSDRPSVPDRAILERGKHATNESVSKMDATGVPHLVVSGTDKDGQHLYTSPEPGKKVGTFAGREVWQERVVLPAGMTPDIIGHSHKQGDRAFSSTRNGDLDNSRKFDVPIMKNLDGHRGYYDLYYRGWRFYLKPDLQLMGNPFPY
jgi:RHS repeat-associated protein